MPAETEKLGEMLERIRRLGSAKSSKELRNLVLAVGTAVADMRTKMTQMESKDRELDRLRDDVPPWLSCAFARDLAGAHVGNLRRGSSGAPGR